VTGRVLEAATIERAGFSQVKYVKHPSGVWVEIGDFRHRVSLEAYHWNRIVRMIREELDESGIAAILALIDYAIHGYESSLVSAIKSGVVREVPESPT
jgi:hypothetical protein